MIDKVSVANWDFRDSGGSRSCITYYFILNFQSLEVPVL